MHIKQKNQGFTIVELLIVIVVIGILAAITIVAYSGVQDRANDSVVQSDLSNVNKKLRIAALDSSGIYPTIPTSTADIRISKAAYLTTANNMYYCYNASTNKYAVAARSKSGKQFKIVDDAVSSHATVLYGADTCALVGLASWSGSLGYDGSTSTWAAWAL